MTTLSSIISSNQSSFPSGTKLLFYQATAPIGWTQVTTQNDKALRVVSGLGGGSGGTSAFTTVFSSRTVPLVDHTHFSTLSVGTVLTYGAASGSYFAAAISPVTEIGGNRNPGVFKTSLTATINDASASGQTTGNTMDFSVQYIDVIIASKN